MKTIAVVGVLLLFNGCTILKPSFGVINEDTVKIIPDKNEIIVEKTILVKISDKKKIKDKSLEPEEIILNVFDDELYFERDKVRGNKSRLIIRYLDAFSWEKNALLKAYTIYKKIWSKKQSDDFKEILEEDKYFALCTDSRYWENLKIEDKEPERDILHSILLIKYLNNLSYGCREIDDNSIQEHIDADHILSLLPHDVLIHKLLLIHLPKEKGLTMNPDYSQRKGR